MSAWRLALPSGPHGGIDRATHDTELHKRPIHTKLISVGQEVALEVLDKSGKYPNLTNQA